MLNALTNISDTPGQWFRLLSLCFGSFVLGYWTFLFFYALRASTVRPHLSLSHYLRWAALLILLAGFLVIQVEALFINEKAVLLWGNYALPVGAALMLWAGILMVKGNFDGPDRRR